METTFDLSVILPIKSATVPFFSDYFEKCIESLKTQKTKFNELIIVHTDETTLVEHLDSFDFGELTVKRLVWTDKPNYSSQINHGIENSTSEWVSLFEFDDEYSSIWFKNVLKYSEIYTDTSVFLPIVVDTDERGQFAGFTNEATFAANFTPEMGILTNETLMDYQNFQISGMVVKKSSFENFGMLKPSFKLTFGYELFLRLTHNSVKVMSIPKIGYKHTNLREGSLFWGYKNNQNKLTPEEVKFWVESAKTEFYFNEDREIKYKTETV